MSSEMLGERLSRRDPLGEKPFFQVPVAAREFKPKTVAGIVLASTLLFSSGGGGAPHRHIEVNVTPEPLPAPLRGFCSGCEANETGDPRTEATPIHRGESFLIMSRNGENKLVFGGDVTHPVGFVTILFQNQYGYIAQFKNLNGDTVAHFYSFNSTTP